MDAHRRLTTKDVALIVTFTALYAVFASIPIFQILGVPSRNISAAAITAPIIGIILGPYVGALSVTLGGTISFFAGSFFPPSYVSGIVATVCAGLLRNGRRVVCALVYASLLLVFGFYPSIGPLWLFPLSTWFQVAVFLILISPLQKLALRNMDSNGNVKLIYSFFMLSLTSTMPGQISGSLMYLLSVNALLIFPIPAGGWLVLWQGLAILYPIERILIALGSTLIVVPLVRVLRSANLMQVTDPANSQQTAQMNTYRVSAHADQRLSVRSTKHRELTLTA